MTLAFWDLFAIYLCWILHSCLCIYLLFWALSEIYYPVSFWTIGSFLLPSLRRQCCWFFLLLLLFVFLLSLPSFANKTGFNWVYSCLLSFSFQIFLHQPPETALQVVRRCLLEVCLKMPQNSSSWKCLDSVVTLRPYAKARKTFAI